MVGSVLAVGLLYVLMIFVATSTADNETLRSLGETASVEVARRLLGPLGAVVITAAGLLATLSSANASNCWHCVAAGPPGTPLCSAHRGILSSRSSGASPPWG